MMEKSYFVEFLCATGIAASCVIISFILMHIRSGPEQFMQNSELEFPFSGQKWKLIDKGILSASEYQFKNEIKSINDDDISSIILKIGKKESFRIKEINTLIDKIKETEIKVIFLIESYEGRDWKSIKNKIQMLRRAFKDSAEIERESSRPVVIIENSEQLEGTRKAILETRRTYLDCFFIGHIESMNAESYKKASIEGYDALTPLKIESAKEIYKNETLLSEITRIGTWEGIPIISVAQDNDNDSQMRAEKFGKAMIIQ